MISSKKNFGFYNGLVGRAKFLLHFGDFLPKKNHCTIPLDNLLYWCQVSTIQEETYYFLRFTFWLLKPWASQELMCTRPWTQRSWDVKE